MNMLKTPSDLAREWFQKVWNERDESAIDRLMKPDLELAGLHLNDATSLRGPEEFKQFHRVFLTAIPDLQITLSKVIEQGDWVAFHFVTTGTHTGPGLGAEPSNQRVQFSGMGLGRVENGKWVEGWNTIDFLTLNMQIGGTLRIG